MKIIRLLFCCTFLLAGCEEDSTFEISSNSYLPLEVGNTWIFRSMQNINDPKTFKKVIAEVTLENRVYAQVISGRYPDDIIYDTTYYRVEDNGFVYSRQKNSADEENRFRLDASDGDAWTYPTAGNYTASITISFIDLELKTKNLRNCKAYYFDIPQWIDEEYTTTLAKNIGFVREYSNAWGLGRVLESATINGRKFKF